MLANILKSDVPAEEPYDISVNWQLASPQTVGLIATSTVC
jgi:hypothetical protein